MLLYLLMGKRRLLLWCWPEICSAACLLADGGRLGGPAARLGGTPAGDLQGAGLAWLPPAAARRRAKACGGDVDGTGVAT